MHKLLGGSHLSPSADANWSRSLARHAAGGSPGISDGSLCGAKMTWILCSLSAIMRLLRVHEYAEQRLDERRGFAKNWLFFRKPNGKSSPFLRLPQQIAALRNLGGSQLDYG